MTLCDSWYTKATAMEGDDNSLITYKLLHSQKLGPGITPMARLTRLSFLLVGPNIFSTKEADGRKRSERRIAHACVVSDVSKNPGRISKRMVERLPHDIINEWAKLREAFAARFFVRKKQVFIMGVPEVMKISSFMDSVKSPELAKRFSKKFPATVNEMMERLDDFVRSEEAYASTELPKGETGESHREETHTVRIKQETIGPYTPPYSRGEYNLKVTPVLTLNCLTKHPKETLSTKMQLRLPVPHPMLNPLRSRNANRYCDYHQEKGHYPNDCIQLKKQLEMALESGKLNHLVKDVRQRGRGSHNQDDPQETKIINVISINSVKDKKRKIKETMESWMNVPISFLAISSKDVFEEPLIVEAELEGYLVRRVYVDEGSSVEVMFEHRFKNLNPRIKDRLRETQTDLVGFVEEVSKPLGKIEIEVCFDNEGLCRRTSMKFIVV
nr:reverse transcriptase domain-containing protein [Tanacetum cinerariifolium]